MIARNRNVKNKKKYLHTYNRIYTTAKVLYSNFFKKYARNT